MFVAPDLEYDALREHFTRFVDEYVSARNYADRIGQWFPRRTIEFARLKEGFRQYDAIACTPDLVIGKHHRDEGK